MPPRIATFIDSYKSSDWFSGYSNFGTDNFVLSRAIGAGTVVVGSPLGDLWGGPNPYTENAKFKEQLARHEDANQWYIATIKDTDPNGNGPRGKFGLGWAWQSGSWQSAVGTVPGCQVATARDGKKGEWLGIIDENSGSICGLSTGKKPEPISGNPYPSLAYPGVWKGSISVSNEKSKVKKMLSDVWKTVELYAKESASAPIPRTWKFDEAKPISFTIYNNDTAAIIPRPATALMPWQTTAEALLLQKVPYRIWLAKPGGGNWQSRQKLQFDGGTVDISIIKAINPRTVMIDSIKMPSRTDAEPYLDNNQAELVVEIDPEATSSLNELCHANNRLAVPITVGAQAPPTADAGKPQDFFNVTSAEITVTLDGSNSGPDDQIVSYVWTDNGRVLQSGGLDRFSLPLAVGVHEIKLMITDRNGETHSDTTRVVIKAAIAPPFDRGDSRSNQPAASTDPNELSGPAGYGPANYVASDSILPYRIDFENDASANAPAQRVTISNMLSPSLDWTTFRLTEIGFGSRLLVVPPDTRHFETTVAVTYDDITFDVRIEAGINSATGEVYAVFQSIDPATLLPPGVLTGFLPPEDGTGRGMGHVSYSVKPKSSTASGTEIRNVAYISFDGQPAISTNQVDPHDAMQGTDPAKEALVTIDAGSPTGQVAVLPVAVAPGFDVSWGGGDEGGSGIGGFTVYVSSDGGLTWTIWLADTTLTTAKYPGTAGKDYLFYVVAKDRVGNVQSVNPATGAVGTTVVGSAMIEVQHPANNPVPTGTGKVDFGVLALGSERVKTFTICNTGPVALRILATSVSGPDAAWFTSAAPAETTLAAGESTAFTVRFSPADTGTRNATLRVASDDPHLPSYEIALSGTGVTEPMIVVQQPTGTTIPAGTGKVDFGKVKTGTSTTRTFIIRNKGPVALSGIGVKATGTAAAAFQISAPKATALAPGASTTFTVAFLPTAAKNLTDELQVTSNDPITPSYNIALSGIGVAAPKIAVKVTGEATLTDGKSTVDFGAAKTQGKGTTKTVTLTNQGLAKLSKLSVSCNGTNKADFIVTPLKVTSLPPGKSAKFKITFKPKAKGIRKAALHIKSNDPNSPSFDITLIGKGSATKKTASSAPSLLDAYRLAKESDTRFRAEASTMRIQGLKYRAITITRNENGEPGQESVEVSPNLMDWFSGAKHTTVVEDTAELLKVRDNTPVEPGNKRYIRLKSPRK